MFDAPMEYFEHSAPADFRRHVQCLWMLRDNTLGDAIQVAYPDGLCELLAELGVAVPFLALGEVPLTAKRLLNHKHRF